MVIFAIRKIPTFLPEQNKNKINIYALVLQRVRSFGITVKVVFVYIFVMGVGSED